MTIIRGKFFTLTPTSKVNLTASSGKNLTVNSIPTPPSITGGIVNDIIVNNTLYRTHTFTSSGILTVTSAPSDTAYIEYLVIGGGGGGGSYRQCNGGSPTQRTITQPGGGGGAGGFLSDIIGYVIVIG